VCGLAERGYPMRLVSFEKVANLKKSARVHALAGELEERGVEWVPLRYHRRVPVLATGRDILQGRRAGRRLHRDRPIRLLHARSYPAGLMASHVAKRIGAPWIFDMRGFWVDERIEAGIWKTRGPVTRAARRAERRLLADSAAVVQLTHQGAALVGALAPEGVALNTTVIPTCVDMNQFCPSDAPERVRKELGIPGGPVMIYSGSLSTWYLPDLTLRAGDEFARRTGGSFIVLTREVEFAQARMEALGVNAIVKAVEHHQVPVWLSAADVGLAFVRPDPAKRASAPTKVGEYLSCGVAVLAISGVGDLDTQFEGATVARTVSADVDPERVVDLAIEMANAPDRSNQARALAKRYYDLQTGIDRYASLYRSLGIEPDAKRIAQCG
jgi:glycosyltransferase involved in cell wall biosynthesis